MKKRMIDQAKSFGFTFLIFFLLCSFVVTVSFLIFFHAIALPEAQVRAAAPLTLANILAITTVFTVFDTIRRKLKIDRPVGKIKKALVKVTNGDFAVKLDTAGVTGDFEEIMERINKMTDELSGVETLRTDFVANVSHEMKTPLAIISNYGILLQDESLSAKQRNEYAKVIINTASRLAELITNILKLNQLENQNIYPQTISYDLSEQLRECLLQFEAIWEAKGIGVEVNLPDEAWINGDRELLSLVWNNLLSNAFKFTESGGTVTLGLETQSGSTVVKVNDTGKGISSDVGNHIFEKFFQGDPSHATVGNGLGLALVKRIIDITSSEIAVESTVKEGTAFTVKLRNERQSKLSKEDNGNAKR